MHSFVSILALVLAAQSLGEVAEKERKRREANARAGVEVISLSGEGERSGSGSHSATEAKVREDDVEERDSIPSSESQGLEDETSALDRERERGAVLEPELVKIAAMVEKADHLYDRYRNECHGRFLVGRTPSGVGVPSSSPSVDVHLDRDWFLVLDSPSGGGTSVPTGPDDSFVLVEPPKCQSLRQDLIASARRVRDALQALLDRARRERILPGVVRELRSKHGLL